MHQQVVVTNVAGKSWHYSYNGFGQPTGITAPLGETTTLNYDTSNQLSSLIPPQSGAGVTLGYDTLGRVQNISSADKGTVNYAYDDGNRLTQANYPDGTTAGLGYTNWTLTSAQDRLGQTTSFSYDSNQRLTSSRTPNQQTTQYGWSAGGGLSSLADPAGNQTSYQRDLMGRVLNKASSDGSQYSYRYGSNGGMLSQVTDPLGQVTQYSHTVDGKILGVNYQNTQNPTPGTTYQYDSVLGRVATMVDGTGYTTYSYNPVGQVGGGLLKSVASPVGQTTAFTTYAYDSDGRVVQRAIDGVPETYTYNSQGQLVEVTNPLGDPKLSYDSNTGRLVSVADSTTGQATQYEYYNPTDPNGASGRLKSITNLNKSNQAVSSFNYSYDQLGRITNWGQSQGGTSKTYAVGYNPANQLKGVTMVSGTNGFDGLTAGQVVSYQYDRAGNRVSENTPTYQNGFGTPNNLNQLNQVSSNPLSMSLITDNSPGEAAQINGRMAPISGNGTVASSIVPSASSTTTSAEVVLTEPNGATTAVGVTLLNKQPVSFDANGNCTSDNQYSYVSDGVNRPIAINNGNVLPGGTADTLVMKYDGKGRRVGLTALNLGGPVTNLNQLSGAATVSGKTYVWCGNRICEERDATGKQVLKRFFSNGEQDNGQNLYYTKDHLGSVREVMDASGNIQGQFDYDPWGRQTQIAGTMQPSFGYTGHFQEPTTGLLLSKYRVYNADMGRWTSGDPKGQVAGANIYSYVRNNPLGKIDQLGLDGDDYESSDNTSDEDTSDNTVAVAGGILKSFAGVVDFVYGAGEVALSLADEGTTAPLGVLTMGTGFYDMVTGAIQTGVDLAGNNYVVDPASQLLEQKGFRDLGPMLWTSQVGLDALQGTTGNIIGGLLDFGGISCDYVALQTGAQYYCPFLGTSTPEKNPWYRH